MFRKCLVPRDRTIPPLNIPELLGVRDYKIPSCFGWSLIFANVLHFVVQGSAHDMRLYRSLPVLSLLLRARAFSLDSRQSVPHRLDVRDTPDVCANIGFYNYIGFGIIGETFKVHG